MPVPRRLTGQHRSIELLDDAPRRGGQAEVYHGRDGAGRSVAVKVANEGAEERRGLLAERDALTAIQRRQPGTDQWLIPVLDVGTLPDGRPFVVLPWFEHSLQSWLRVRRPGLERRLEALMLAGEAVVRLHRSAASLTGVVLHRDIKPSNLLVDDGPDGLRVVLADLGGVKERRLHGETQNTGIHTPYFAPLEQALPLARPPDPSVDVHALAVLSYVVLAGRAPQAVMVRQALLTDAADELVRLHLARGRRTSTEAARYEALQRSPISAMIDLDGAQPLPGDDVRRLRDAMLDLLADRVDAEALADELTGVLVPTLRHALELDPSRRLSRPEGLLAALEAMVERLGGRRVVKVEEGPSQAPTPPSPASVAAQVPVASTKARPGAARPGALARWGAVGLSGLAMVSCLGLTAVAWKLGASDEGQRPGKFNAVAAPASGPTTPVMPTEKVPPASPAEPAGSPSAAEAMSMPPPAPAARTTNSTARPPVEERSPPPSLVQPVAQEQTPTLTSPEVLIRYPDDGDATVKVDGKTSPNPWRRTLGPGTHSVVLESNSMQRSRTFDLHIEADGRAWRVSIRDPLGDADPPLQVSPGALVRVTWDTSGGLLLDL